jgi:hypothetical protein
LFFSYSNIDTPTVEVFKTNVQDAVTADRLLTELHSLYPDAKFNFALDDSDKILRAQSSSLDFGQVADHLKSRGFLCEVLE